MVSAYNKGDTSALDADVFSFSYNQNTLSLDVFSESGVKQGTYDIQFRVNNQGYDN